MVILKLHLTGIEKGISGVDQGIDRIDGGSVGYDRECKESAEGSRRGA